MFGATWFKSSQRGSARSNRLLFSRGRRLTVEPLEERALLAVASLTGISLSSQAITYGQSDTFTARVVAPGLSPALLAGSVQFYVDGTAYGSSVPLVNGQAQTIDPKLPGGSHSVYATFTSGNPSVVAGSQSAAASVGVAKALLTITASAQSPTMVYGSPVPGLTYTATGYVGGDSSSNYTLLVGPTLATTARSTSPVGQYAIIAGGAFDPNYTFAYVNGTLTITPAVLTMTAQNASMVYGSGTLPKLAVTYSGLVNGDLASQVLAAPPVVSTAATATSHGGAYTISVSGATLVTHANYSLKYVNGTLTITPAPLLISASPATMVYGGTVPTLQWTATGLVNGDTQSIISPSPILSGASSSLHVGVYNVTPSGAGLVAASANDYAISYVPGALTVTPANLILKANDETVAYGTTNLALNPMNFTAIGLVNGDTLASIENTGNYFYGPDEVYGVNGTALDNTYPQPGVLVDPTQLTSPKPDLPYSAAPTYPGPSVTLTIPANSPSGVYPGAITFGQAGQAGSYTIYNDNSPGDVVWSPGAWWEAYSATPTQVQKPNTNTTPPTMETEWVIGSPIYGQGLLEQPNANGYLDYNITYQSGTLTIQKYTFNVVVNSQEMTYGDLLPTLTYSYSGLMPGDTITSITGGQPLSTFITTTATSQSEVGVYQIGTPFTSQNPNYTVNFTPGTLTIDPRTLDITVNDQWVTYGQIALVPQADGSLLDEMPDQSQFTVSGLVNGDQAAPNLVASDDHAGQVMIYVASVNVTGNGDAADYVVNTTPGIATITPAQLTITTLDQTLTYGDVVVVDPTTFALPNDTAGGLASQISVSGWQYNDNLSSLNVLPMLTTDSYHANADAQGNLIGATYTIYASGPWLSNDYTVQYVNAGQLTILPHLLTISPVDAGGSATITTTYGADPNIQYVGGQQWNVNPIATLTGLSGPSAMAFDLSGNLYVANQDNDTVSEYAGGTLMATLTGVNGPVALALDANGDLCVANSDNTVSVYLGSSLASGSTTPDITLGGLDNPVALAFDANGNLYVANYGNGAGTTVSVFLAASVTSGNTAPDATLAGLFAPQALAFDSNGNLYVANSGSDSVSVFDQSSLAQGSTTPDTTLATGLMPDSLAFDANGNLYVANYGDNTVSVFARGSTTAAATLTGLDAPSGLVCDALGNLYVSNSGANSVSVFVLGGTTPIASLTGLTGPASLALDGGGDLYVANYDNGAGVTVSEFAPPTSQLQYGDTLESLGITQDLAWSASNAPLTFTSDVNLPVSMAISPGGDLYVANAGDGTVSEFAPDGTLLNTLTGFSEPVAVKVDANGDVYVADVIANTVSEFDSNGNLLNTLTTGVNQPVALAFDSSGNLYVANAGDNTVSEFDTSGNQIATLTGLDDPVALALDASGQLYAANVANDTVSVFAGGSATPTATLALPTGSMPYGLALDSSGNLYVANEGNSTVSVFDQLSLAQGSTTPDSTLTGLDAPNSLIFDASGNLYVSNAGASNTVSIFDQSSLAQGGTTADGTLTLGASSEALAVDSGGHLYVATYDFNSGASAVSEFPQPATPPHPTNAGSYLISAMAGVPDPQQFVTDYTLDYGTATLVINKAQLTLTTYLTLDGVNPASEVVYNGTDYNQPQYLAYGAAGLQYGQSLADVGLSGLSLATDPYPAIHVGSYTVNFDNPPDPNSLANYTLNYQLGSFAIDPVTLTVTAVDQSQDANGNPLVYGGTQPDLTASSSTISVVSNDGSTPAIDYGQFSLTTDDTINPYTDAYHAGSYTITVNGPSFGPDYVTVYQPGALTIQQAALSVTPGNLEQTYGVLNPSNLASFATYTVSGLVPNDSLDTLYVGGQSVGITGQLAVSSDAIVNPSTGDYNAGPADLFVTGPAQTDDYVITYDAGGLQIDQAQLTIQAIDQKGLTYGGTQPNLIPSSNPPASNPTVQGIGLVAGDTLTNLGVTAKLMLSTDDTLSSSGFYHAGAYSISVAPQPQFNPITLANYTISYASGTLQINPNPSLLLTVTATPQTGLTYGGAQPNFTPSASTVTVTGLLPADANSFNYANLLLTTDDQINPNSGKYDAGTYNLNVGQGPNGSPEPDYTITYVNAAAGLQIARAPLSIKADDQTYNYGGADGKPWPTLTANLPSSAVGLVAGDTVASEGIASQLVFSTTATPQSHVSGSPYVINVSGPSQSQDYQITYLATGKLTITPDTTTLVFTANNLTMTYGSAALPPLTFSASGFVNSDTLTSLTRQPVLATTATAASPAGSYPITFTSPAVDPDYVPTYVSGTLTIAPAVLTFTANDQTVTYGAASLPQPLNFTPGPYSISGLVNGDTAGSVLLAPPTLTTTWQPTGSNSHVAGSPYPIYIAGAVLKPNSNGAYNYTVQYVAGQVTVNPAPLTITADNKAMLQGANPASLPLTVSYAGFVNGDTAASLTTPPTIATTATSSSPAGSYPITASGAVDRDYAITYRAGVLTVDPTVNAVYLLPDPLSSGNNILYIWGTYGNDTIMVAPGSGSGNVSVTMNGVFRGSFGSSAQPISRIVAHGIAGRDTIGVSQSVTLPAWLYGDSGASDSLSGGGGPTYLFGGAGFNSLWGGTGRSILIGGAGSGTLMAGSGDAILIGGTTVYNPATPTDTTKDAGLLAIMNEWSSNDSYAARVAYLSGVSGGKNGPYYLKAGSTVLNNNAVDRLIGSAATMDLFFKSARDTLTGQRSGESIFSI